MRKFAPLAAAAVAAALLVAVPTAQAATGGGTTSKVKGYDPPPVTWGKCSSAILAKRKAECGFLTVPLDYAKPDGTKIKLALSRIKATAPAADYKGVMLTNPGGPGGSGLTLSVLGQYVPNKVGLKYDWIGFDPRGVGNSEPELACDPTVAGFDRPQYIPYVEQIERVWLKRSKNYAKACAKAGGSLLDHVKTTDTVQDMDSIRQVLGAEKLNFYGFSYGTYLGTVYSTLHPDRVGRFVLDGVVDPTRVWYPANLDQDIAFDRGMTEFWKWLAKYNSVYKLGTNWKKIKADYYLQYAKLDRKPAKGKLGPDELNDVMLGAGYYVFGWEDIGKAFSDLVRKGDATAMLKLYPYDGTPAPDEDNGYAMYLATQCSDVQWPTSWSTWRQDNWATFAKAPFLTWGNAWYNAPCLYWPAKPGTPVTVDGSTAPPVLLVSETKDGATPYSGALKVRSLFPKSALIEGVGGTTHAGSLSGVACTDNAIASYLDTGVLPARKAGDTSDLQCDPVPQPDPTATQAASVSSGSPLASVLTRAAIR